MLGCATRCLESRFICGVGKQQLSVVRDHYVMRNARLDLLDDGGAAKGSDEVLEQAAPVSDVEFGLQSPVLLRGLVARICSHGRGKP